MDFTIFYKQSFENGNVICREQYDLFISAFDGCERTESIFGRIDAKQKIWLIFPHYHDLGLCPSTAYDPGLYKEDEYFNQLFQDHAISPASRICVDITGFIRPHLIFLLLLLDNRGLEKIDFIYSEPDRYEKAEDTRFSEFIDSVRLVEGCSAVNGSSDTTKDLLIISAGYDDKLISKIAQDRKDIRKKYLIVGFPSLQPDFYQESVLKLEGLKEILGTDIQRRFSPAFDPFMTAQLIKEIVESNPDHSNIYLSPLSTKAQTLGMALYYIWNYRCQPLNIIFPFSNKYHARNCIGLKKTWKYTVQLPRP